MFPPPLPPTMTTAAFPGGRTSLVSGQQLQSGFIFFSFFVFSLFFRSCWWTLGFDTRCGSSRLFKVSLNTNVRIKTYRAANSMPPSPPPPPPYASWDCYCLMSDCFVFLIIVIVITVDLWVYVCACVFYACRFNLLLTKLHWPLIWSAKSWNKRGAFLSCPHLTVPHPNLKPFILLFLSAPPTQHSHTHLVESAARSKKPGVFFNTMSHSSLTQLLI